jgi:hypothetical protein
MPLRTTYHIQGVPCYHPLGQPLDIACTSLVIPDLSWAFMKSGEGTLAVVMNMAISIALLLHVLERDLSVSTVLGYSSIF